MTGFIAIQRSALEHPVIGDPERFYAWFWLLSNACWKPTRTRITGKIVSLERGQLSYSQRYLADAWGWSKSRVDRFMSELREEGMISTCSKIGAGAGRSAGQGQAIITICNYDKYQTPDNAAWGSDDTNNGAGAGQERGKEEQGNKGTKKKPKRVAREIPDDFWPDPSPGTKTAKRMSEWTKEKLETEVERFIAHHQARGNKYPNWQGAWTTWALNNFQQKRQPNGRNSNNPPHDNRDEYTRLVHSRSGLDRAVENAREADGFTDA